MGELAKLPNIGKVLEEQLNQAGITTYEELKEIGSRQAWLKSRPWTIRPVFIACIRWKEPYSA